MNSPWSNITVSDYEGHMKFINQYDLLNQIFKEQLENEYNTICILGIGCGNGLEYIKPESIVYGYDINSSFLDRCRDLYGQLDYSLILKNVDLMEKKVNIYPSDLLISNLVLEYIGLYRFTRLVKKSKPHIVSVVLQLTLDNGKIISDSPFTNGLNDVLSVRSEIVPQDLTSTLDLIGYKLIFSKTYEINQFKSFIRIDYSINN